MSWFSRWNWDCWINLNVLPQYVLLYDVQFFLWQACHAYIPTMATLTPRGVNTLVTYPLRNADEARLHCLFCCTRVVGIWIWYNYPDTASNYINNNLDNLTRSLVDMVVVIGILTPLIMWNIWILRNKFILEGTHLKNYSFIATIFTHFLVFKKAFRKVYSSYFKMVW